MDITVVVPCLNELPVIEPFISSFRRAQIDYERMVGRRLNLLVVDDGSTDGSLDILRKTLSSHELFEHPQRMGYGKALKTGIKNSKTDFVAFMDMDMTYPPASLIAMAKALKNGGHLVICGNRFSPENQMPVLRKIGNKLYALTLSIIFFSRINDCCSGIRLFHRSAILPYLEHLPDGLDFTPAMTIFMKKLKIKFLEMKVPYHERLGESKLSVIKDGFRFWHTIFRFSFLYDYHSISTATREWR